MSDRTRRLIDSIDIDSYLTDSIISPDKPRRIQCGITDDFSQFEDYFGNRNLNEKRALEIGNDIVKYGNISSISTVREGRKLLVWDGQHVLNGCRATREPVNYDVYDKVPDNILTLKNKHTKQWTLNAFHEHFCRRKFPVALRLERFMIKSKELLGKRIELTATLRMLGGSYSNQKYKDNEFKITHSEHGNVMMEYLMDFKEWVRFPADSKFVQSLNEIVKTGLYDHNVMKNKSYKAYGLINSPLRQEDTVRQIQDCYNYGRKKANHVNFLEALGYRNAR
jgi:hypothetical protein